MVELEQPSRPFLAQAAMGMVQSPIYCAVAALLIAIVRRVLVLVAEVEHRASRTGIEDFVIEMAGLGGLALALVASIYLLRRSAAVGAQAHARDLDPPL
jgi:hypothetical protein